MHTESHELHMLSFQISQHDHMDCKRQPRLDACGETCLCVITGPVLYWRPAGILVAFPVVAYGFTTHHFLFTIYASLKAPSARRVTMVAQKVKPVLTFYPNLLAAAMPNHVMCQTMSHVRD